MFPQNLHVICSAKIAEDCVARFTSLVSTRIIVRLLKHIGLKALLLQDITEPGLYGDCISSQNNLWKHTVTDQFFIKSAA